MGGCLQMRTIVFIVLSLFILGCSTTGEIKRPTSFALIEADIAKGIEVKGSSAEPVNQTSTFLTEDREAIAYAGFRNLSGEHRLRWEWIDPSGRLYYSTGDYPLNASAGKYSEQTTAWHRLSIKGEEAAAMPGDWQVNVYLDGSAITSKNFKIDVDVDSLTGLTQRPDHKKWGLIIAIERYPSFPAAEYTEADARLVKEYLMKTLGVPEENIISLFGSDATKARIKGYLKSYLPKNVSGDTTLYVYYGGHGIPFPVQEKVEPYLVPYDSDTVTITETGYRLGDFYGDIDSLNIKQAFIFLDACFSGIASRGDRMLIAGGRPIIISIEDRAFLSGKLISFTSSSGGEMSSAYPEKRHGLFTYFLLRGLRGEADTDKSGTIMAGELYDYVKSNVNKLSRRNGVEQTPEIAPPINTVRDVEVNKVIR
ncbi:MAG: caspase family protein [Nitrospira sp.]|nr:caspase family protein [Nitrospira sp.]